MTPSHHIIMHRPLDRRAFRESLRRKREKDALGLGKCVDGARETSKKRVSFNVGSSPSTIRSAKALLGNWHNPAKRAAGWQVMGALPEDTDRSAVSALVQARAPDALGDPDPRVRRAVCRALRQLMQWHDDESDPQCIIASQVVVEALASCLEDPVLDVQLAASIALPCMGPCAIEVTRAALSKERAQAYAARVLSKLGVGAVRSASLELSCLLRTQNDAVRSEVVASFRGFQEQKVVESIASMAVADEDRLVRLEAIKVLQCCSNGHCLQGHTLQKFSTSEVYTCDRCEHTVPEGVSMFGCRSCDYDLCQECVQQACPACAVQAVKRAALHDKSWEVRRAAVLALPKLGDAEAVVDLLKDEDGDVRFVAADLLGQLALDGAGDKYVAEVAALLGGERNETGDFEILGMPDPDPQVRWSAARSLGRMCSRAVDVVLMPLLLDSDSKVRYWTVSSLGKLSQFTPDEELPPRVAELSKFISDDPAPNVRKITISMLAQIGHVGQAAWPQVVAAVIQDSEATVRLAAVEALADMVEVQNEGPIGVLDNSEMHGWHELVAALRDTDRYVRVAAAKAIATLAQKTTPSETTGAACAEALGKVVQTDRSWGMCAASIEALVALEGHAHTQSAVLSQLLQLPPTETSDIRKAAADALGSMAEAGAAHGAVLAAAMVADPSEVVRYCCAWALGELGVLASAHACDAADALGDGDADVREAAARALGSFGDASLPYVDRIADQLQDGHADVRAAAASALRALGEGAGRCGSALAHALREDPVGTVRAAAAGALGTLGITGREYNIDLQGSLSDSEVDVRVAAIVALGELNKGLLDGAAEEVSAAIAKALTDSSELVRSFALDAMECLGTSALHRHRQLIGALASDSDSEVRAFAARLSQEVDQGAG